MLSLTFQRFWENWKLIYRSKSSFAIVFKLLRCSFFRQSGFCLQYVQYLWPRPMALLVGILRPNVSGIRLGKVRCPVPLFAHTPLGLLVESNRLVITKKRVLSCGCWHPCPEEELFQLGKCTSAASTDLGTCGTVSTHHTTGPPNCIPREKSQKKTRSKNHF